MSDASQLKQEKVVFPFQEAVETLFCSHLGNNRYRLENIPIFAYGVSLYDIFAAKHVDGDPRPYFDTVLERSGNRTCRVIILEGASLDRSEILRKLSAAEKYACGWERYSEDYYIYNVPPEAQFAELEEILDDGEDRGYWEWEVSSNVQ